MHSFSLLPHRRPMLSALSAMLALTILTSASAAERRPTGDALVVNPVKTVYTKDNAPETPKLEELELRESVSQYGITWTFDKPSRVGRFINGDWYVVGKVTIKMIDPKPLWGDEVKDQIDRSSVRESMYPGKQCRNGSSLNPPGESHKCGLDSRLASDRYDPEMAGHLPIEMKPGDTLVSSISRPTSQLTHFSGEHVNPLRVAAVLSCVAEPLPPDAFRPSYCDSQNSKIYLARNLRRDLLPNLKRVGDMPDSLDKMAAHFQKPWIELSQWGFAAPVENLPDYGQQFCELTGEAVLLLACDYSAQEKETLLVNYVQVGLDLFGLMRRGKSWRAHGGLNSGRKWPIIFAGIMLDEPTAKEPGKHFPETQFHEDTQTAFGPLFYRGQKFEKSWSGSRAIFLGHSTPLPDKDGKIETPEAHWLKGWGLVDVYHPKDWPKGKRVASESYRIANTSGCWVGQALAARIMHAEKYWNHDAFFAYVDRWMTEDDTPHIEAKKEAGWGDYTTRKYGSFGRQGYIAGSRWVRAMWNEYRNNLPPADDGAKTPPAEQTWK